MSSEFKPLATLHGGRTKKKFKFFWNTENHHVYLEQSGFFGSSKVKTGAVASSWEMAYHAAEAYVFDR
ncbi:MAG TPA: hypothetical protein VHC20_05365 [Candidatus Paceibacterota bacterium]|nr:hypothetical protein [Candidatus Paceibacterota bacterium]